MYGITEKQAKRLVKIVKFNKRHPDNYCWADLHDMAVCEDREVRLELKESAKNMNLCREDIKRHGGCWCGKFKEESE